VEVFHRLYQQAITLREKMEMRRNMVQRSEAEVRAAGQLPPPPLGDVQHVPHTLAHRPSLPRTCCRLVHGTR
jgi:hypothetical protein